MKTTRALFLGLTALALVGAGTPSASAGEGGWATAGKVLTGVVAGSILAHALEPAPTYVAYPAPVYYTAPTVVVAAPAAPVVTYVPAAPMVVYLRPVIVAPAPVVYAPPVPVVAFTYGGYGCRPRFWHRW